MSIRKAKASELHRRGETYVTTPSATIKAVKSPEALAILLYLLDKPKGWIVRRDDVRKRFSIGRDRYERAMKELRELHLVWSEFDRDAGGKIIDSRLCVSASPVEPPNIQKTGISGKTAMREKPQCSKSDHLDITDSLNTTDSIHTPPGMKKRIAQSAPKSKPQSTRDRSLHDDLTDDSWAEQDQSNSAPVAQSA